MNYNIQNNVALLNIINDGIRTLELFKKHGYIVQMGYILFDRETTYQELVENYQFMLDYDFAVTKGIFSEMFLQKVLL